MAVAKFLLLLVLVAAKITSMRVAGGKRRHRLATGLKESSHIMEDKLHPNYYLCNICGVVSPLPGILDPLIRGNHSMGGLLLHHENTPNMVASFAATNT